MRLYHTAATLALLTQALLTAAEPNLAPAAMAEPVSTRPVVEINADNQHYDHASGASRFSGNVTVKYNNVRVFGTEANVKMMPNGEAVATFPNHPVAKRFAPAPKDGKTASPNSPLLAMGPVSKLIPGNVAPQGWLTDVIHADTMQFHLNSQQVKALGNTVSELTTIAAAPMTIRADVQEFDNRNKLATATGSVQLHYKDFEAYAPKMLLNVSPSGQPQTVKFLQGVRLKDGTRGEITSGQITYVIASGNMMAEGGVKSRVNPQSTGSAGKPPITIESDYQQFDKTSNTVIASGHVRIVYEDYRVSAPKATFKIINNTVETIDLIGRSSVSDGDRTITADKIILRTNPKSFDAKGNVKTQFKSQPGLG
ncbi:MAG: LptA/OstA family protein [Vampirovibrionales bacterium]|nr:LptA/OstA family protein [Vampirovibrionales bacterium]